MTCATQPSVDLPFTLHLGDAREVLCTLPAESVDSVVCDPPYGLGKQPDTLEVLSAWMAGKPYERRGGGFISKCFHPDTDILTEGGWKRVGQVRKGERVATLDPVTRKLVWQPVVQVHAYQFKGDLVHVRHRSAEQMVTPNHNLVLSTDGGRTLTQTRADATPPVFHMFAQCKPVHGRRARIHIESERAYGKNREVVLERATFEAAAFFKFFGMWLGDGYCVCRTNSHPANDFFGFTVKKPRKVVEIRETLLALGIHFNETLSARTGFTCFYCYDFALLGFLKSVGKAQDKHIPGWMFDWDASLLEHLYRGLMDTDGCLQGSDQEVYSTISSRLADDFQRLCLQTGRSCLKLCKPGHEDVILGKTVITQNCYVLPVLKPGKRLFGATRRSPRPTIERVPYTGKVHCVGVPEHHTLYTRFNGKPVWSGNSWDSFVPGPDLWRECWRVLKPGGHLVAFFGTRTYDIGTLAIRLAGFEIRDQLAWIYAQGFPHSMDVARGMDESETARKWEGWGTTLKPAQEPICLARKPFAGTVAKNVLAYGVGGLNIDACRIQTDEVLRAGSGGIPCRHDESIARTPRGRVGEASAARRYTDKGATNYAMTPGPRGGDPKGRWPANVCHDGSEAVRAAFPNAPGQVADLTGSEKSKPTNGIYGEFKRNPISVLKRDETDKSAARFFFCAKASKSERNAGMAPGTINTHPTVKPVRLMAWLCRLVTPPGGTVLDPTMGSGSTGIGAIQEGFRFIGIENEGKSFSMAQVRLIHAKQLRENKV